MPSCTFVWHAFSVWNRSSQNLLYKSVNCSKIQNNTWWGMCWVFRLWVLSCSRLFSLGDLVQFKVLRTGCCCQTVCASLWDSLLIFCEANCSWFNHTILWVATVYERCYRNKTDLTRKRARLQYCTTVNRGQCWEMTYLENMPLQIQPSLPRI